MVTAELGFRLVMSIDTIAEVGGVYTAKDAVLIALSKLGCARPKEIASYLAATYGVKYNDTGALRKALHDLKEKKLVEYDENTKCWKLSEVGRQKARAVSEVVSELGGGLKLRRREATVPRVRLPPVAVDGDMGLATLLRLRLRFQGYDQLIVEEVDERLYLVYALKNNDVEVYELEAEEVERGRSEEVVVEQRAN